MAETTSHKLDRSQLPLGVMLSLPALLLITYFLFFTDFNLAPTVSMHLDAARLVLAGKKPYLDFWDWSQPIVFALHTVPYLLNKASAQMLSVTVLTKLCIWFCLLGSFTLSIIILNRRQLVIPVALAFACGNLAVNSQFGTVQHLFLLAVFPWLLMRWLKGETEVSRYVQILAGASAALGCLFDLPFILVLIWSEGFLLLRNGGKNGFWHQVLFFLLALVIFFFISLTDYSIWQGYFQWTMPMRMAKYFYFDSALKGLSFPDCTNFLYLIAAVQLGTFYFVSRAERSSAAVLVMMANLSLSGFALFMAEGEGLRCDFVIGVFATVGLLVFLLHQTLDTSIFIERIKAKQASIIFLALLMPISIIALSPVFISRSSEFKRFSNAGEMDDVILKWSKRGDGIAIISQYPNASYPRLSMLNRMPAGYLLWARPLRMLQDFRFNRELNIQELSFQTELIDKVSKDFLGGNAALILVEEPRQSVLLKSFRLWHLLKQNYQQEDFCTVYAEPYGLSKFSVWRKK